MPPQLPARIHRPHSDTPLGDGSCLRTSAYGSGTGPGLCRIRAGVFGRTPRRAPPARRPARTTLTKLRDDLGGQPLGVLGQLEQRREQDQFRAGLGDLAQFTGALGRRARDRGGLDVWRPAPVQPLQRVVDPVAGASGALVHGDVDALGDAELLRRAGRPGQRLAHDLDLAANFPVNVDPAPKKPSPSRMARRSAAGPAPPNQIGGCGCWAGLGSIAASLSCQNSPSKVTRGSVHSAFISARPSVNRATYRPGPRRRRRTAGAGRQCPLRSRPGRG